MKQAGKIILILCVVLAGCIKKQVEATQVRRTGINGEAIYVLNPDGSLKFLFKEKYSIHDFTILIINDTINLGDDFTSFIGTADPIRKIRITSPDSSDVIDDPNSSFDKYIFRPKKAGIYDFRGTIEFDSTMIELDSTVAEFEYKFIVVED